MPPKDVINGPHADPAPHRPLGAVPPPRPRSTGTDPEPSTAARAARGTGGDGEACVFNRWCTVLY
ncbi:hypothetical protein [Streptomyces sp. AN091965]|uniref:hypothetical protein n=1 Tax=Streptomyces sp. AN091965 TaxID=2927803 RepID=UPI001F60B075|nr:hypothetical protein [Streptomyces sp. AN091965]MCI3928588.1 hypothetical protein [Streptomyces sp. AN091965]